MTNLAIFEDQEGSKAIAAQSKRELSPLAKSLASHNNMRRIATNTNGTFKRLVNGEQIGKAIRGEFNGIVIHTLPKVSRTYYAGQYDPDAKPTLPDCWSNLGDKPEANVPNRQAANCTTCHNNIDGSGQNGKGKACRFQRRVALLLEGDDSGDIYQFNIPAKSLFGKGEGNVHPFESYARYLAANGASLDYTVTNIAYDLDAETMQMQFKPVRLINDDELEIVQAAQQNPDLDRYVKLVVAEVDGAIAPKKTAPVKDEPNYAAVEEEEDEIEEPAAPVKAPAAAKAKPAWLDDDEGEAEEAVPVKRASRKAREPQVEKKVLAEIITEWTGDAE